jgi:hypothetical protein
MICTPRSALVRLATLKNYRRVRSLNWTPFWELAILTHRNLKAKAGFKKIA